MLQLSARCHPARRDVVAAADEKDAQGGGGRGHAAADSDAAQDRAAGRLLAADPASSHFDCECIIKNILQTLDTRAEYLSLQEKAIPCSDDAMHLTFWRRWLIP